MNRSIIKVITDIHSKFSMSRVCSARYSSCYIIATPCCLNSIWLFVRYLLSRIGIHIASSNVGKWRFELSLGKGYALEHIMRHDRHNKHDHWKVSVASYRQLLRYFVNKSWNARERMNKLNFPVGECWGNWTFHQINMLMKDRNLSSRELYG